MCCIKASANKCLDMSMSLKFAASTLISQKFQSNSKILLKNKMYGGQVMNNENLFSPLKMFWISSFFHNARKLSTDLGVVCFSSCIQCVLRLFYVRCVPCTNIASHFFYAHIEFQFIHPLIHFETSILISFPFLFHWYSGKPRGLRTARKHVNHRRDQRWADKDYKKAHLGTRWKANPFGGASHAKGIVLEKV